MKTASRVVDLVYADGACANARKATPGMGLKTPVVEEIGSQEELDILIQKVLDEAGTTIPELREQGELGRFETEQLRHAWHILAGTGCF